MAKVSHIIKNLQIVLPIYNLIRDCLDGEVAVKKAKTKYLPQPNPSDKSKENAARYDAYLKRAVFYNVCRRTLNGFVGQVFMRDPVIEVPTILDIVVEDVNGGGISLSQSSKKALGHVLSFGRAGLFVDYPTVEGGASKAQLDSGDIRPTINLYEPWKIINWRTAMRGAKEVLALIVLQETYVSADDGFEAKESIQYRVLRLEQDEIQLSDGTVASNSYCVIEIWRSKDGVSGIAESYMPRDASGALLNEIPFSFIGSENNDPEVDNAPLYDLASLNIAHYRNSADYEEACYMVGQPTPYFSGLTKDWVDNVFKGQVNLGSRAAIPLPEGGSAGLLQATETTMPKEAMDAKEKQMVAIGARLFEQTTVQRTATEASLEEASESSMLSSIAKNVSEAYEWALAKCEMFMSSSESEIVFELNDEFDIAKLTAQELKEQIAAWQKGTITFEELRKNLRKSGIAHVEDEEAKETIEEEQEKMQDAGEEADGEQNEDPDNVGT